MMVKKFYADSSREALRLVRDALGPNAMILSNRKTAGGVEVMAVSEAEVESVTQSAAIRSASRATAPSPFAPPRFESASRLAATPQLRSSSRGESATRASAAAPLPPVEQVIKPAVASPTPADEPSYALVQEVRILRSMLEGQLAAFAWQDLMRREPAKIEVLRRLLAIGFSSGFARRSVEPIAGGIDSSRAMRLVKLRLQQQLDIVPAERTPVELGGVYALVGPTGVGKTTTVAKIGAECTLKHGPQSVALVTTDTYRIGAVDQLRIYGKILGAPVFAIRNEADLAHTLTELRARHLVLIDTVGMSQRDQRLTDQIALLAGDGKRIKRLLLLSGVSQVSVLDDVVKAYRGEQLAGCILTKMDETLSLGGVLEILLRYELPLHYVTNGQRVPEDLHRPNPLYLVERAFRGGGEGMQQPHNESDYPLMYAAGVTPAATLDTDQRL
ncbi:MAG: flagellar biosynthesis protein FlhF [Betaproteobacteria bacterium]